MTPIKEAFAETSDLNQATFKIRCFICKGRRENHWDENRLTGMAQEELKIIQK